MGLLITNDYLSISYLAKVFSLRNLMTTPKLFVLVEIASTYKTHSLHTKGCTYSQMNLGTDP